MITSAEISPSPFNLTDPPCGCGLTADELENELALIKFDESQRHEAFRIRGKNEWLKKRDKGNES